MKRILIALCCNGNDGTFEGCVRRIEFSDAITLEAISLDRPPRIAFVKYGSLIRLLRISGRVFPVLTYAHCAGRQAFDCVTMESAVAAELLNFLKGKGTLQADSGYSSVFEVWGAEGGQFSAEILEAACVV